MCVLRQVAFLVTFLLPLVPAFPLASASALALKSLDRNERELTVPNKDCPPADSNTLKAGCLKTSSNAENPSVVKRSTDKVLNRTKRASCMCQNGGVCVTTFYVTTCDCPPTYTGLTCEIPTVFVQSALQFMGVDRIMSELTNNPITGSLLTPFLMAQLSEDDRIANSWTYDEMFYWVSFEDKILNLTEEMYMWNDVQLGNCFTFNHLNSSNHYFARLHGTKGGFKAMMKPIQAGPLVPTTAIIVFITGMHDVVYSQSIRYNSGPGQVSDLRVTITNYKRLGGKYGTCINNVKEVRSFYSGDTYSVDGCYNACYQDAVYKRCSCMDPRYHSAPGIPLCSIDKKDCVDAVDTDLGDPSAWPDCVCPLPCENTGYTVQWSQSRFTNNTVSCDMMGAFLDGSILNNYEQMTPCAVTVKVSNGTLITVQLPKLHTYTFQERPKMDMMKFMSYLGGILGMLCGICVVTFFEFAYVGFRVATILLVNR